MGADGRAQGSLRGLTAVGAMALRPLVLPRSPMMLGLESGSRESEKDGKVRRMLQVCPSGQAGHLIYVGRNDGLAQNGDPNSVYKS